jgi:hypothetical protein
VLEDVVSPVAAVVSVAGSVLDEVVSPEGVEVSMAGSVVELGVSPIKPVESLTVSTTVWVADVVVSTGVAVELDVVSATVVVEVVVVPTVLVVESTAVARSIGSCAAAVGARAPRAAEARARLSSARRGWRRPHCESGVTRWSSLAALQSWKPAQSLSSLTVQA